LPHRFTIIHHPTIGSTNDEARRLLATGVARDTVIHADQQTAGRGRLARTWFSPPGNLYLSVILRCGLPPARATELSFVAALAVAATVKALLPPSTPIVLKWPNDVLVNGGKIAGILLEHIDDATVIGIGVNILHAPQNLTYRAATIVGSGGIASVASARSILLDQLSDLVGTWETDGFPPIRSAWLERSYPVGTALEATVQGQRIGGRFAGLADDGALLLQTDGGVRRIIAADVDRAG
jgi:BirA family transcriptional regulator, biotin operon repressor / biotin---[acetyl-CoA-carboxylase] ligase